MNHSVATLAPAFFSGLTRRIFKETFGPVLAIGLTIAPAGACMAAEVAPVARIGVYARHVGGKIVYYYQVTNKSTMDITAVSIGYDTRNDDDPGNDAWELSELPSGWNPKLGIPSANSNSPTGWRVSMTTPGEESKTHAITWEIINNKSPVISTGQTVAKMSIALDKADASYLTGHALVTFSSGSPAPVTKEPREATTHEATTKSPPLNITVPVESIDATPPTIAVVLTPNTIWSQDNKHIPVNATFPLKEDDYDKLPEIKLESVTASEPLEPDDVRDAGYGLDDRYLRLRAKHNGNANRVYTVIYSAIDASGNKSTASATVTVPATEPATTPVAAPAPLPASAPAAVPAR